MTAADTARGSMSELVLYFLRLGLLGFGGPVACARRSREALSKQGTTAMRMLVLVLLGLAVAYTPARAQMTIDCKSCPVERKICRQAHSQQACDSEYAMCLKHCRRP